MSPPRLPGFDPLSPELALEAVEEAYALRLDGSVSTYPSYVNRVYGLRSEEGEALVAKFYRPGRWSRASIEAEHRFLADCAAAELPVVVPLPDPEGSSLASLELEFDPPGAAKTSGPGPELLEYHFALYPRRGGRNFDAETEDDWRRLGSLAGRLHRVGRARPAPERPRLASPLVESWLEELRPLVHPEFAADFEELLAPALARILPRLDDKEVQRIHGDLHRGNILERPGEGLLLIDFDDCLTGPPVQDLWLLLPGRSFECRRELSLLLEGYGDFAELEPGSLAFIESLRLLRMLHFLAWRARQRHDAWFAREFPDWGGRAFWIQELESLRDQIRFLEEP